MAHELLEVTARDLDCDVCLISEPNLQCLERTHWIVDPRRDAAIWIRTGNVGIKNYGSGDGYVWIETDDWTAISCYISPNCDQDVFEKVLDDITHTNSLRKNKNKVIGGDFNAKAKVWGSKVTDRRGKSILEWMATEGLYLLNDGKVPTFYRRGQESYLDLSMVSGKMLTRSGRWKVSEDMETASDHRYISFLIGKVGPRCQTDNNLRKWNVGKINKELLAAELEKNWVGNTFNSAEEITKVIQDFCSKSMPKIRKNGRKRPVYWWNDDIKEARMKCVTARRRVTRARKKKNNVNVCERQEEYKKEKKNLNILIKRSKDRQWKILCEEIEEDIWGLGYKIVCKKIGRPQLKIARTTQKEILEELFPQHPIVYRNIRMVNQDSVEPFTTEELKQVVRDMKGNKTPGPDGIPNEIIKELVRCCPKPILEVMNNKLHQGKFPRVWKQSQVILIPKPGKVEGGLPKFRPICLLNSLGKLLEGLILKKINKHLEGTPEGLSNNQFGFRRARSTIHAISKVMEVPLAERDKPLNARKLCMVIALDIKNAFNSAPWDKILEAMEKKAFPPYLIRMVENYLSERIIQTQDGYVFNMTAGVPQGSVLGPTLWNVLYDGVLGVEMPDEVSLVAYADDLAVVVKGMDRKHLEIRGNESLERIDEWMREHGLEIAPEKSKCLLLIGRKRCITPTITLAGKEIKVEASLKYLGVTLDRNMSFSSHVEEISIKALERGKAIAGIMPRVGGPGENSRRTLYRAVESILLYAAPVWSNAMGIKRIRRALTSVQRTISLRVCRAYRTVSTEASLVLARLVPVDIMVEERASTFGASEARKREEREGTMKKWQDRWERAGTGSWTRKLIPDITAWYSRKHGEVSYHLTQVLTGHGCFAAYLHRIGKKETAECWFCGDRDDSSHTLFECVKWDGLRSELLAQLPVRLNEANLVTTMIEKQEYWDGIAHMIETIMRAKERHEQELKE